MKLVLIKLILRSKKKEKTNKLPVSGSIEVRINKTKKDDAVKEWTVSNESKPE